jgi:general secretion pathway protein M
MKDWFASLDDREQKFVVTAAVFLAFAILYLALWMPLDKGHKQAAAGVEIWQSSIEKLKPLKGSLSGNSATRISPSNLQQPLVVVIDSTLRNRQLNTALQRSQPAGDNISVEFENVAFDELVMWLGDLSSQYALQVQSGNFSVSGAVPGRIDARLILGR